MQTDATCEVSKGAHYTWSFPGSITVELELEVVRRLQSRLDEAHEGLLFGHTSGGASRVVDFRVLSPEDAAALRSSGHPAQGAGSAPIGYFRIARDGVLRLNADDLALAKSAFPNPDQIILLIQKKELEPASASVFFWEGSCMFAELAFLEFPFDAEQLAEIERARAAKVNVAPPLELPDAARRAPARAARHRRRISQIGTLIGGCILAVFAAVRFSTLSWTESKSAGPASVTADSRAFGLRVERGERGALLLKWDRRAEAVLSAAAATLMIQDGETPRVVSLYDDQIRGGMLLYSPVSERVQLRLTLERPGHPPATEVVLVILAGVEKRQAPRFDETKPTPPARGRVDGQEASSGARHREGRNNGKPETPASSPPTRAQAAANTVGPGVETTVTALPLPPLPASAPEKRPSASGFDASPPSAQTPDPISPEYQPPVIVSRTLPVAPSGLQGSEFKPETVELTVSLDDGGRIERIVPASPRRGDALTSAAVGAVQKWRFKPAQLGNRPVRSQILLKFNFQPLP